MPPAICRINPMPQTLAQRFHVEQPFRKSSPLFLTFALLILFALHPVSAGDDVPKFTAEVYGNGDLIFRGCIKLPPLASSVDRICVVEDSRTHIRFIIDEVVNTASGGVATSVYGQGRWVEK